MKHNVEELFNDQLGSTAATDTNGRAQLSRDQVISRLRKPANRTKFTRKLAAKLTECSLDQPCSSPACLSCRAVAGHHFVPATLACFDRFGFVQTPRPAHECTKAQRHYFRTAAGREIAYVTIIPLSRIAIGDLCASNKVAKFVKLLRRALNVNGVTTSIFALDVSTHEHASGKFEPHYKIHAHGFIFLDEFKAAKSALRLAFPNKGNVKCGVQHKIYDGQPGAISYLLKEPRDRSIKLDQALKNRNRKKANRLRSAQHVEILQWMDHIGLDGRLMVQGDGTQRIRAAMRSETMLVRGWS